MNLTFQFFCQWRGAPPIRSLGSNILTARSWDGVWNDVEDLKSAVVEYQHANPGSVFENIDLETCSWADVFKHMEEAQIQYDERDKHGLGSCRAAWRKFGRKTDLGRDGTVAIDPWLDLIPNDYGLSVVRGAIVLVLMVSPDIGKCTSARRAVLFRAGSTRSPFQGS